MKIQNYFLILIGKIIFIIATLFLLLPLNFLKIWQGTIFVLCFLILVLKLFKFSFKSSLIVISIIAIVGYFQLNFLHYQQLATANQYLPTKITTSFQINRLLKQGEYCSIIASLRLPTNPSKQRIYLVWKGSSIPQLDDVWQGELRLHPLTSRLNFRGFDKQKWFFSQGITAYGYVTKLKKLGAYPTLRTQWLAKTWQHTQGMAQQGLLLALAFGERAWLSSQVTQVYQQTNTAHLIAISGLHVGLVFLLGFYLTRLVQYVFPVILRIGLADWIGLFFAIIYAYLAGFSIPTLRALLALFAVIFIRSQRLCLTKWQYFWLVVVILLCCDPKTVLSESFWLSFAAVLSLLIWYQFIPLSLWEWRGKPLTQTKLKWFIGLIHLQIGLLWLLTPWQLFFFNGISLSSFWANLWVVPLFSFVLIPIIFLATLFQTPFLWHLANRIADFVYLHLSEEAHNWCSVTISTSLFVTFCLSSLFLMFIYFLQRQVFKNTPQKSQEFMQYRRKWHFPLNMNVTVLPASASFLWLYFLLGIVVLMTGGKLTIDLVYKYMHKSDWQATMLDVGQGLSVAIERHGHVILYDTGNAWGHGATEISMAKLEILPYLQRTGGKLDGIIISHDDRDHTGGLNAILTQYPHIPVWRSAAIKHSQQCVAGEKWQWQGLTFSVLSPSYRLAQAKNAQSCVILISDSRPRLLLMGDAPASIERTIAMQLLPVDVIQVGHHGSKTSTTMTLLAKTQPKVALISVGRWNPWHLPNKKVVNRLKNDRIATFSTAQDGAVRVIFSKENIELQTARYAWQPWYQAFIGVNE
ncbi:hypothetical protein A6A19_08460 [Actinobacillus delphinicola]|uniref:DNA internalization-related competence protein ComEC/Rec2 n=1 Tax=Actinobacillus delphinicola TaxID=51161 RepID=UPI002451EF72|nr:hypothetical protein [Actinobacillus delphinicola]